MASMNSAYHGQQISISLIATASLEKDTLQRSADHTEGRVFFNYYIENRETQKNLKNRYFWPKNGIMLVSAKIFRLFWWYHVGILKTNSRFNVDTAKCRHFSLSIKKYCQFLTLFMGYKYMILIQQFLQNRPRSTKLSEAYKTDSLTKSVVFIALQHIVLAHSLFLKYNF